LERNIFKAPWKSEGCLQRVSEEKRLPGFEEKVDFTGTTLQTGPQVLFALFDGGFIGFEMDSIAANDACYLSGGMDALELDLVQSRLPTQRLLLFHL
jgi:hypothetical protein